MPKMRSLVFVVSVSPMMSGWNVVSKDQPSAWSAAACQQNAPRSDGYFVTSVCQTVANNENVIVSGTTLAM